MVFVGALALSASTAMAAPNPTDPNDAKGPAQAYEYGPYPSYTMHPASDESPFADPPLGPPPPPAPRKTTCCVASIRADPFNLIFRRLTIAGEIKLFGPVTLELEPSWIFGSATENLDQQGLALVGRVGVYPFGRALRGLWVKAQGGFEGFNATLTHSAAASLSGTTTGEKYISSGVFGAMVGGSSVFGRNGGFTMTGGIGIGFATAPATTVTARGNDPRLGDEAVQFYGKADRIRLLGSLGLGVTF
jgi:hypothetical protein